MFFRGLGWEDKTTRFVENKHEAWQKLIRQHMNGADRVRRAAKGSDWAKE